MTQRVTTVTPSTAVTTALRLMYIQHIRHLPVVADGRLVGIVSDRDVRPAARSAPVRTIREHLVGQVMTPAVRWVRPDDELYAAIKDMLAWRISALPVVEHDQLVGILTTTDCLGALLDVAQTHAGTNAAPS
jgi:acetoin utilization protein AcuB